MIVPRTEVSQRFIEAAESKSQKLATKVLVFESGQQILELPVTGGEVQGDAQAPIRRTGNITLQSDGNDGLVPTGADHPLAPHGNQFQLARGFRFSDGTEELVSLGFFRIDESDAEDAGDSLEIGVNGQDRSIIVADAVFEAPYQIANGTLATTAILDLVIAAIPDVQYDFATTSVTLPALYAEEGDDRWELAQGIAESLGGELFFNAEGLLVLQPVPEPNNSDPYLSAEEGSNLIRVGRSWTRTGAFNKVIVTGETTGSTPVRGEAFDNNPLSPTYYFGPFGKVPVYRTSEFVTTAAQAQDMANGILSKELGTLQQVRFDSVVDPRLAPSDIIQVKRDRMGIDHSHVLDTMTVALDQESAFSGVTRAVQVQV